MSALARSCSPTVRVRVQVPRCSYRRVRCVARGGPIHTPSTTAGSRWGALPPRRCLTVAAGAATLLGVLAVAVVVSAHTFAVDLSLHDWLLEHRTAGLTSVASAVTATGASGVLVPVVFLAALVARSGRVAGPARPGPGRDGRAAGRHRAAPGPRQPHRPAPPASQRLGRLRARLRLPLRAHHDQRPQRRAADLAGAGPADRRPARHRGDGPGLLGARRGDDPRLPRRPLAHRRPRRLAAGPGLALARCRGGPRSARVRRPPTGARPARDAPAVQGSPGQPGSTGPTEAGA